MINVSYNKYMKAAFEIYIYIYIKIQCIVTVFQYKNVDIINTNTYLHGPVMMIYKII